MASWRIRFHDKWPHLASLYASTHNLDEEGKYPDPMMGQDNVFDPSEPIGAYRYYVQPSMTRSEFSIEEPGYSIRPAYKDEESRSSDYTSGDSLHRGSTCRVLLCVFLVFSFIGVVVTAVTLAVLLSKSTVPPKSTMGPVEEFSSETKIYARDFNENLLNNSSREFKALEEDFCNALLRMFTDHDSPVRHNYVGCEVIDFRNGSIIARFKLKIQSDNPEGFKREARIRQKIQEHFAKKIKETGPWQRVKFDPTYVRRFVKVSPEITTESQTSTVETTTADSTDIPTTISIQLNATNDVTIAKTTQIDEITVSATESQTDNRTAAISTGVTDSISTLTPHTVAETSQTMAETSQTVDISTPTVNKSVQTTTLQDLTTSTAVSFEPTSSVSQTDISVGISSDHTTAASTDVQTTLITDEPSTASTYVPSTSTIVSEAERTSSADVSTTSITGDATTSSSYVPTTSSTNIPSIPTYATDIPTTSSADVLATSPGSAPIASTETVSRSTSTNIPSTSTYATDIPTTSSADVIATSTASAPIASTETVSRSTSTFASTASTSDAHTTSSLDIFDILSTLPFETLEVSSKKHITTQSILTEMATHFVTENQTSTPKKIMNMTEQSVTSGSQTSKDVESTTFPLDIGTLFDDFTETSPTTGSETTTEIPPTTHESTTVMPLSITKEKQTTITSAETSQAEIFTESIPITEQVFTGADTSKTLTGIPSNITTSIPVSSTFVIKTAQESVTPTILTGTDSFSTQKITTGVSEEDITIESTVFVSETTDGIITQTAIPIKQSTTTENILTDSQSLTNIAEKSSSPSLSEFNITDGTQPVKYTTTTTINLTTSPKTTIADANITTELVADANATEQSLSTLSITGSEFATKATINVTEFLLTTNTSITDTKMNVTDAYTEATETTTVDILDSSYLDNTSTPSWMDITDMSTALEITSDISEISTSSVPLVSKDFTPDRLSTDPPTSVTEQNVSPQSPLSEISTEAKTASASPYDNTTHNATGEFTTESATLLIISNITVISKNESAEHTSTFSASSETTPISDVLTKTEASIGADVKATNVTEPEYIDLSTDSTHSTLIDITTSSISVSSTPTKANISREANISSTVFSDVSSRSPAVTTESFMQTDSSAFTDFPLTSDNITDETTQNTTTTQDVTAESSTVFQESTIETDTLNLTTQSISTDKTSFKNASTLSNVTEATTVITTESVIDESTLSLESFTSLSNDTYMTTMQPDDFNFTNFENVTIQYPEFNATDNSSLDTETSGTTVEPVNTTYTDVVTTQHSEVLNDTKIFADNVTDAHIQTNVTVASQDEVNITSDLSNVTQSTADHTFISETTEGPIDLTSFADVTSNVSEDSFVTQQPSNDINATVSDLIDSNLTDINKTGETKNVTNIPFTNENSTSAGNFSDVTDGTTQFEDPSTAFPDFNFTDIDLSTFAPDITSAANVTTTTSMDVLNISVTGNETTEGNLTITSSNDTEPLSSITTEASAELISKQNKTNTPDTQVNETKTAMGGNETLGEARNETNITALPTTEMPQSFWLNTTDDLLDWGNATGFPDEIVTTDAPDVIIDSLGDKTHGADSNITSTFTNGTFTNMTSEAP